MMTEEKSKQQKLMIVTMENLMPQDHFLRRLEENLSLDFVYDLVRPLYINYLTVILIIRLIKFIDNPILRAIISVILISLGLGYTILNRA